MPNARVPLGGFAPVLISTAYLSGAYLSGWAVFSPSGSTTGQNYTDANGSHYAPNGWGVSSGYSALATTTLINPGSSSSSSLAPGLFAIVSAPALASVQAGCSGQFYSPGYQGSGALQEVLAFDTISAAASPSAPVIFKTTASTSVITLYMSAPSNATSFNVKRSINSTSGFATVAASVPGTPSTDGNAPTPGQFSFTDSPPTPGVTYYYQITAVNAGGESPASNTVVGMGLPTTPTALTAAPGDGRITLAWGAAAGAASYSVYRGLASAGESPNPLVTGITALTWTDAAAANGTRYFYTVAAVNAGGAGAPSNEASAVPLALPGTPLLLAQSGSTQAVLSWYDPPSGGAVASYKVFQGTAPGGEGATPIASGSFPSGLTSGPQNALTVSGLSNGTTYYFFVQGVNGSGGGTPSNEVFATPLAPPAAPTGLTATAGNGQVVLAWTPSAGATSYSVFQGTSAGGESILPVLSNVTGNGATIPHLTNGTAYFYTVKAFIGASASAASNEASATPLAPAPPAAPTSLTATAGVLQVALAWTAVSGAVSYRVYRGRTTGGPYVQVGATAGVSFTDYVVQAGVTYFYVVTAVSAAGTGSANSNEASATPTAPPLPLPTAPANLVAISGLNGQVPLYWSGVSGGATSFNLYRGTAAGAENATPIATGIVVYNYTDATAVNGTTYFYYIKGVNSTGIGPQSNEASATPAAPVVVLPSGSPDYNVGYRVSTGFQIAPLLVDGNPDDQTTGYSGG